mmetsp:Transcript_2682/g.3414  ORF Transcript_2682/g.3414 Transcript_2682/m.3414 type:complete len:386 (+) Transcript_2682:103-1260(+)
MSGAFITQTGQNADHFRGVEVGELEALVSGIAQTSQSTLLLKKKKEMREVDDSLDFMKHQFRSRMETCEANQRKFEDKQQELKQNVLKFEKFIQENDAKRQRAEVKLRHEQKTRLQKESDLAKAVADFEEHEKRKAELLRQLDRLKCYKEYLEGIVDQGPDRRSEFEEVDDLLMRYRTLELANLDLMQQVQKGTEKMDALRKELQDLRVGTQNAALVQSSQIQELQMELEDLKNNVKKSSDRREAAAKNLNDETRETGQIIMGIRNLYNRCTSTSRMTVKIDFKEGENSKLNHLDSCLKFICEKIVDLNEIVQGYNESEEANSLHRGDDGALNRVLIGTKTQLGTINSNSPGPNTPGFLGRTGAKVQASHFKPTDTIQEEPSGFS